MRYGAVLRLAGEASRPDSLARGAQLAEAAGLDELWVADHVAIAPTDGDWSDSRYLDPLATLAFLASATRRIELGTGILVLPFRPAVPTAKALATIQELSGGRLNLGVGVGWRESEFRAVGVPRSRRGAMADEALEVILRCLGSKEDEPVTVNGQEFLFRSAAPLPKIFVAGKPPHAFDRAAKHAAGWMRLTNDPEKLAPNIVKLREHFARAGRSEPEVVAIGRLGTGDVAAARERARRLEELGVTRLVTAGNYKTLDEFERLVDGLLALRE